jgi:transposase
VPKIGCTPETLRVWYQKYLDQQNSIKVQQLPYQERIKQPERENKEVQRANEILRKAATFSPRWSSNAHTNNAGFHP